MELPINKLCSYHCQKAGQAFSVAHHQQNAFQLELNGKTTMPEPTLEKVEYLSPRKIHAYLLKSDNK